MSRKLNKAIYLINSHNSWEMNQFSYKLSKEVVYISDKDDLLKEIKRRNKRFTSSSLKELIERLEIE